MKIFLIILFIYFFQILNLNSNEPKLDEIIKNLNNPWSLSFINNDEVIITEKSGNFLKINLINKKIKKIDHDLNLIEDGQGGLLEVLYHDKEIFI